MGGVTVANLIRCKDCKKKVSINATSCPNCGAPVVKPEGNQSKKPKTWIKVLIGLAVFLFLLSMCSSGPDKKDEGEAEPKQIASSEVTKDKTTEDQEAIIEEQDITVEEVAVENKLTTQQKNAVRSAERYLSVMSFSRKGLINQLSSEYGDGYNVEDATIAVDSMNIDYNEQAAKSAKNYLNTMGFSCKGLIDQLSSDAGDKYTQEQASYGAKQAGACD